MVQLSVVCEGAGFKMYLKVCAEFKLYSKIYIWTKCNT